jgi:hypothetical protein
VTGERLLSATMSNANGNFAEDAGLPGQTDFAHTIDKEYAQ